MDDIQILSDIQIESTDESATEHTEIAEKYKKNPQILAYGFIKDGGEEDE